MNDDKTLSLKAQNGDEEAVNLLMKKYKSLVNKIARYYFLLGGDIEDVIQEGMIGLYKAIMHFASDKHTSFKTFASTCIKHQIQSAVKVASAEKNRILTTAIPLVEKLDDEEEEGDEIILPSDLPSPDDQILEREGIKELKEVISKSLTPLEMKILIFYLKGYSYDEIAKIANISKKSIDNGLSRIKNKLSFLKDKK